MRGLYYLEQSGISLTPYNRAIREMKDMFCSWARWMVAANTTPGFNTGYARNYPYNHRQFLVPAAFLWIWNYSGDKGLYDLATTIIDIGLAYQMAGAGAYAGQYHRKVSGTDYLAAGTSQADVTITPTYGGSLTVVRDGVFPEQWVFDGLPAGQSGGTSGWDVSYQNSSIRFASICWGLLPASETSRRASLLTAVQKGCNFQRQLVTPSDTLEPVGSTRIGNGDLTPSGAIKTINYYDAVESLAYAGQVVDTTTNRTTSKQLAYGQGWVLSPAL